jgi:hypothetical protein
MTAGPIPPAATRPRRPRDTVFLCLCGTLAGVAVVALATLMFGHVTGEEFCPSPFARRSFHYLEIPLVHVQVSPITRSDATQSLERTLQSQGYIPAAPGGERRWDLVHSVRAGSGAVRGDAAILCAYLDAVDDDGQRYWESWTRDHPESAKALWPAVARVAAQQLYIFVPELMGLARSARNAEPLGRKIDDTLTRQYARLAAAQQQLGDAETAVELYDAALQYTPEDPDLLRRREQAKRKTDETRP